MTQFAVPGAYLLRPNDASIQVVYNELRHAGILFIRKFLAHATRSDYLVLFDREVLRLHAQVEEDPNETPVGSWAALVKKAVKEPEPQAIQVLPEPTVVEAKKPKARIVPLSSRDPVNLKKMRPGRHARQMLKALQEASTDITPEEVPSPPKEIKEEPKKEIPENACITLRGSGPTHPVFRLRPFMVSQTLNIDEIPETTVPHLLVYHPPREKDVKPLAHVEKCQGWIKKVLGILVTIGLLPSESACRVLNPDLDASRLSRPNLAAMQCRFKDDVPLQVRNAVYAILRSSPWFQEVPNPQTPEGFLVRCWWRQVSAAGDDPTV